MSGNPNPRNYLKEKIVSKPKYGIGQQVIYIIKSYGLRSMYDLEQDKPDYVKTETGIIKGIYYRKHFEHSGFVYQFENISSEYAEELVFTNDADAMRAIDATETISRKEYRKAIKNKDKKESCWKVIGGRLLKIG